MDTKTLIEEELSQAGEPSPISPLVMELDKFRIMSDTDVPPRVMWYDTEQSRQSTKGILANRVFKLIHPQKEDPDAMSGLPSMGQEALQDKVMSLAGIRQAKYYDKVFQLAMDQRVVQTTMDRNGRIVAILIPS